MPNSSRRKFTPTSFTQVTIDDDFWAPRQHTNRTITIPAVYQKLQQTGHIDALRLQWKPGDPNPPHIFWESDLAKWMEAASYSLAAHPDEGLDKELDALIALLGSAQQEDGYINAHFTTVEPEKRWTNLRDWHELYCAGHLVEAAVAHYYATGKRTFLDIMCRYVDYIDSIFGPEPGKKPGYPGHQEIELALVKLYHATGEQRYLNLSKFFIEKRGCQPHFYDAEARARGEAPQDFRFKTYEYNQSHQPAREQHEAVGHAVRAIYMYSAMADLAHETGDASLLDACEQLFTSAVQRRMYVIGGLGSAYYNEGFTYDYDLPNDSAYAETCAAIGLFLWMHRMLHFDCDGRYADVMERSIYNGILSSLSLDGDRFFYVNPLAVKRDGPHLDKPARYFSGHRQEWYDCACCPPNIVRLFASLGNYIYATNETDIAVHQFIGSRVLLTVADQEVALYQETQYPWEGTIKIRVVPQKEAEFGIRLRKPGWCRAASVHVNGELVSAPLVRGYLHIQRTWQADDEITLRLAMPIERVYAHPQVRMDNRRVAIQRGPIVYCLEGTDNPGNVHAICLPRQGHLQDVFEEDLLGAVVTITGDALQAEETEWEGALYRNTPAATSPVTFKAIPYYAWDNRDEGDMLVWLGDAGEAPH